MRQQINIIKGYLLMKNEYAKQTIGTKKSLILEKLKLNIILSKTALLLGFS